MSLPSLNWLLPIIANGEAAEPPDFELTVAKLGLVVGIGPM
jgi:hypothetical protein